MKIVCMDCQNESYSDLESLKANGRVVCAQCAENSLSHSDKEVEASRPLPLNEGIETQASPLQESSVMSETPVQDEEVLELSDDVFISDDADHVSDNNVILFPELGA